MTITVQVSEDAYLGDAQFIVTVDGKQVGGVNTATTMHNSGNSQTINIADSLAPGAHTVGLTFLNDAYGGSNATDRNLYVQSIAVDGKAVTLNTELPTSGSSAQASFTVPTTTDPAPAPSDPVSLGSGPDVLALDLSEDAYQGDAQFTISVDGQQIGGTQTVTASHANHAEQEFDVRGTFGSGSHVVAINFLNDAYGGTSSTDRNLYLDSATLNGTPVAGAALSLSGQGSQQFTIAATGSSTPSTPSSPSAPAPSDPVSLGSGPDVLALDLSEDAYQGDAQFTISVDGQQIGGTQTATASHANHAEQEFDVHGTFGSGSHVVAIDFLNDAYGGTSSTDRNLYLDSATLNGTPVAGAALSLSGQGSQQFTIAATGSPMPPTPPVPTPPVSTPTVPTISAPASATDTVNAATALKGISVTDTNSSGKFTLSVNTDMGQLAMSTASGSPVAGSGTASLSVTGTLAQINADLANLSYTGNTAGTAHITFNITDPTGASASAVSAITVQPAAGGSGGNGGSTGGSGGAETFDPSARGGSLLPDGYLSTSGSQIVDADGNPVRIDSIGWYGTDGPAGSALQGLWAASYENILDSVKGDGENAVRITWSDADLNTVPANTNALGGIDFSKNAGLQGLTTLQIYQKIVAYADTIGLKVIFDHHTDDGSGGQQPNGLWIDKGPGTDGTDGAGVTGTVDAAKFQADWVQLASTFQGNSTVIGYDLDNEPTEQGAKWGGGGPDDIQAMYTTVGNAVEAADPGALIIAEGPVAWGENGLFQQDLTGVQNLPVALNTPDKVVYSVHEYPNEIAGTPVADSGSAEVQALNKAWGYLVAGNIAPVWIGEMGSNMTSADSQAWASTLLGYLNGQDASQGGPSVTGNEQGVSTSWWSLGWEGGAANTGAGGGSPDGNQNAWGIGNYRPLQQAATDQLLFKPTAGASSMTVAAAAVAPVAASADPTLLVVSDSNGTAAAIPVITSGSSSSTGSLAGTVSQSVDGAVTTVSSTVGITTETVHLGSGSQNMSFTAPQALTLFAGSGTDVVKADSGSNTFVAGTGSLDVTGGSGMDSFIVHAGAGQLTIEDFAASKGDSLTVDKSLQAGFTTASDGHNGSLISFGAATTIDLVNNAAPASSAIHWV
jgi:endoglucanase